MKRIFLFFFVCCTLLAVHSQNTKKPSWNSSLDSIQSILLPKDYLFHTMTKKKFKQQIQNLKITDSLLNENQLFWKLSKLITSFKDVNLSIAKEDLEQFPFAIKAFNNKIYLTQIHQDYDSFLSYQLLKVNGFSIEVILRKIKKTTQLNPLEQVPKKSILKFLKMLQSDTLKLSLLSPKGIKESIQLPFYRNLPSENITKLIPLKTPFYQRKKEKWFWSYGINYGKQLFCKINLGLSKEHINKMNDSLGWSAIEYATKFKLNLQNVYDAPSMDEFTDKIILKFKKRRYKKLFIDFRNTKIGSVWALQNLIHKIKNHKRLRRRKKVYLFVDSSISSSAVATIKAFQKKTKVHVIGVIVTKTSNDTDKIKTLYFPNSMFSISYPIQKLEMVTLVPNTIAKETFQNYINGVDTILQKVLDK